jgi:signal transduction histidine kinase
LEFFDLPAFGVHDLPFILAYGLFLVALARFPSVNLGWRSQVRIILDALVGAVSVATIVWLTSRDALAVQLEGLTPVQTALGITYPILDTAIIVGAMVAILRRGRYRFDVRLFALVAGFALQSAADLDFLTSSSTGLLTDARPNMVLFIGASSALLVTGLLVGRAPSPVEVADRRPPLWSFAVPYSLGIGVVVLHLVQALDGNSRPDRILDVASFAVLLVVIARQALAIYDNRTKVEFERRSLIASVSHELRTPLTSMIGFLTVMQEAESEMSPEERTELSQVVLDQANYMGRMVTDIVFLARDTPEKMTLSESEIPITTLLTSILDTLGQNAGRIDTRIDADLAVRIDVDRICQLSVNLLENAVRYGADRCEFHLHGREGSLVIEVHDDGPGVPAKYQQTIWERFERGSNQLNATVPGTGLGLAIVDMIAKAHGGTAHYRDSELLGGACFSVTLPSRVTSQSQSDEGPAPVRPSSRPASVRSL